MNEPIKKQCPVCKIQHVPEKKKFCSQYCYLKTVKKDVRIDGKDIRSTQSSFTILKWLFIGVLWISPALWFMKSVYNNNAHMLFNALLVCIIYSGLAWAFVFKMIYGLLFPKK